MISVSDSYGVYDYTKPFFIQLWQALSCSLFSTLPLDKIS
jgi:hypothetical protein